MLSISRWKVYIVLAVTLLSVYFSLPSFLSITGVGLNIPGLPSKTVNLGLDLQGGSHLLLEVDLKKYMAEQLDINADDLRKQLRDEKAVFSNVEISGNKLVIRLLPDSNIPAIKALITKASPDFEITEEVGALNVAFSESMLKDKRIKLIEQSIEIVRRRVDETGTKEPIIQRQGDNRILLQVPGVQNPEHLKSIVGKTAKMTFHLVDVDADPGTTKASTGSVYMESDDKGGDGRAGFIVKRRVMLSGDLLVDAHANYDQGMPIVNFRFNDIGARKFADITRENVGKPFAIVLDNKVISAPVIREPILGGSGMISGNFSVESANDLALLLRAGALPAPLKVIEERTVGPSLGQDSIKAGKFASLLSLFLVMLFMVLYYSLFGFFSCIALTLNLIMLVAAISILGATLTLPGIAGVVLSLGMAVDANVLIYERIKEEIRNGKSVYAGVEGGFKRSFITILDSHITTLVASIILYVFGSGTIKGFAVTLAIGIICSMFTATLVNRIIVYRWVARNKPKVLPV